MASSIFKQLNSGDVGSVRRILSMYESSATIKNNQDHTPLHVAALKGSPEMVRELLKARAPHDALDAHGNTPMHLAAENGSVEVVTELLTGLGRRTVLRMKNKEGRTPLHLAAKAHHVGVVVTLMQSGACAAIKDKSGATPLELVPNLALDDPVVQALMGQASKIPRSAGQGGNLRSSHSSAATPPPATPPPETARPGGLSPSTSMHASKDSTSDVASHVRAAAAAAAAAATPTSAKRSGLPQPPSLAASTPAPLNPAQVSAATNSGAPTPTGASGPTNLRSSTDAEGMRGMTPAAMRRLRAASNTAIAGTQRPVSGVTGRPAANSTPSQANKRGSTATLDASTPEGRNRVGTSLQRGNSANSDRASDGQDAGDSGQSNVLYSNRRSEQGGVPRSNSLSSSHHGSRQNSQARRDSQHHYTDWRKTSGAGELLEAHDTALRELLQSVQRVEEQQAELVELQGKVREAENTNSLTLEEHAKALKELREHKASMEGHEAALREAQEMVQELQAGMQDANSRSDLLDRALLIQGEHAERLSRAREAAEAQSNRVEDLEARVLFLEDKGRESRNRLERVDDQLKEAAAKDKERRDAQDALLRQLQSSLARVVSEQQLQQSSQNSSKQQPQQAQLSEQQAQQLTQRVTQEVTQRVTAQVTQQLMDQLSKQMSQQVSQQVSQQMSQQVSQQVAQQVAQQQQSQKDAQVQGVDMDKVMATIGPLKTLPQRMDESQLQISQLNAARSTQVSEIDSLRQRVCKMEEVGAGDQIALLQLRLQQLSNQLSEGAVGWQEAGKKHASTHNSSNGIDAQPLAELRQQLSSLQGQVESLQQQLQQQQQQKPSPLPEPPSTPTQGSEGLHAHSMSMSALSTPASTGSHAAAARSRQASAAAAAESQRAEELADVRRDLKSIQGQLSSQAACVEMLRGEVKSALANVRQEWQVAVETAAVRHAEQMAEGKAREDRLKSMRDAAMADDEARRKALDLETRVLQGLKGMENTLSLVQHKIEVLEEQLEEVSTNAAESSMAAENNAAELATLKDTITTSGTKRSEGGGRGAAQEALASKPLEDRQSAGTEEHSGDGEEFEDAPEPEKA